MASNARHSYPTTNMDSNNKKMEAPAEKKSRKAYDEARNKKIFDDALRAVKACGINPNVGLEALLDPSRPHKRMFKKEIIATAHQITEWREAANIHGPIHYNKLKEKGELALARKKKLQAIAATPSVKTPVARRPSGARPSTISKKKKDDAEAAIAAADAAIVGRPSGSALANTSIDRSRPVTSAKISAGSLKDDSYDEVTIWVDNVNNKEKEIADIEEQKGLANKFVDYQHKVLEEDQRDEEDIVACEDNLIAAQQEVVRGKEEAAKMAEKILMERKARKKENESKRHKTLAQMQIVIDESNQLFGKQHLLKKDLHRLQQGAFLDQGKFGTLPTESEVRVDRCQTIMENPVMCRDLKHDLDNASMASPQPVFTPSAFKEENGSAGSHPTIDLNQYAIDDLGDSSSSDDDDAWDHRLAGSLNRLIIPKLKVILKGMGLAVSGKKSVLIERLVKSGRKEEVIQRMAAFVNE